MIEEENLNKFLNQFCTLIYRTYFHEIPVCILHLFILFKLTHFHVEETLKLKPLLMNLL